MKRIFLLILAVSFVFNSRGQTEINPDALNVPVLITGSDGGSGSGFFYIDSLNLYLVTAKHVILKPKDKKGEFTYSEKVNLKYYDEGSNTSIFNALTLDIGSYFSTKTLLYNDEDDVIVIPIATYEPNSKVRFNKSVIEISDFKIFKPLALGEKKVRKFDEVTLGNDIFLFGYPKSLGLLQSTDYNFDIPLLRKGTMAGKNTVSKKLIIDCPSYGGNSGGPVFNYKTGQSDFDLVGIVVSFIPFTEIWENKNYNIRNIELDNSGYSIVEPIDKIIDLINNSQNHVKTGPK